MEDSHPQAILKFHRLSSLDYRVRHELPVKAPVLIMIFDFDLKINRSNGMAAT